MFIAPYNLMKRFISYNMNLMNKPFLGDLINSLLGTGEGVGQAQEWGHKAMDVGKPHGVTGPYGSTSFDQETGMSLQLSPEQQEQIGMFTSLLAPQMQALQDLSADPFKAGGQIYEKMVAASRPEFQEQYLGMEARGQQQGRGGINVGGTGRPEMTSLLTARERAKSGMMVDALAQAQQMRASGLQNALGLLAPQQQAFGNLMGMAGLGTDIGKYMGTLAGMQGQTISGASAAADKGMFDMIGQIGGGMAQS